MSSYPVPDTAAATTLGAALRDVGYSEEAVHRLLGEDAYSGDRDDALVDERRLPHTHLGTVVRALFLQLPVSTRDAAQALGRRGVEALRSTGLAEVGDEVSPRVRILPLGKLLVAADGYSRDEEDPPDYVAAYTPTSRLCDSLTPRPRVARALDVGTGSGVHALLAASHCGHVVATDVNARALAYTELNAALNGLANVECRRGSLFDPVEGERFDLITCNAPYVVSPERRWAYRDSGLEADEVSERVVSDAAGHLAEGGFATLLVSWLARDENDPDERVLAWTETIGCDSWILPTWDSDPLGHAAEWNSHLADDPEAFGEALDEWTEYFNRLGVRWVSEGAVLLHRRPGRGYTARVDSIDEDELEDAGEQIERAFAARARLSELSTPTELLDARISPAMPLLAESELEPRNGAATVVGARLQLSEGTNTDLEVEPAALEVVAALDGRVRLRDVIRTVADRLGVSESEQGGLRREALDITRELLELGALRLDGR
jgi:methylase of polypeptide subunit release factors